MVAVPHHDAGGKVAGRVKVGPVGQQVNRPHPLVKKLVGQLWRAQMSVKRLAAGHRHGIIVQHLVGDVCPAGDRLADCQDPGMEIGAVAKVHKAVLFGGKAADRRPRHALGPHMGEGFGRAVHPLRHEMTADPGHRL